MSDKKDGNSLKCGDSIHFSLLTQGGGNGMNAQGLPAVDLDSSVDGKTKNHRAAELLIKMLEDVGVKYVFGIPGGAIEDLNTALFHSDKIKVIVAKNEQGAAYMADGFARVSGELGVCCATAGPGASNLITGLATSNADSVPVFALTGQVAVSVFGKCAFNMISIFSNFTKFSAMVLSEERAEYMFQKAIRLATTHPTGPVHLSLPVDVMKKIAPTTSPANIKSGASRSFDRHGVRAAAEALINAKNPAIIAGWGVTLSRGSGALLELAESLHVPVATSPKGKGVFPESNPLSLGVLGFAGSEVAEEYILENDIDVLLAVGTSFNEMMSHGWDDRMRPTDTLIHIDVDIERIDKNYHADIGLVGDARATLREISHAAKLAADIDRRLCRDFPAAPRIKELRRKYAPKKQIRAAKANRYHPGKLVEDIQKSFPKNTIFFSDIGSIMAWAINRLVVEQPYSFFVPLGFGGMGYGTAAPVGAKLAAPDRPVVALVGDGGFLMNGLEAATAVNYSVPVVWIIFNNAMHGMIYHGRKMFERTVPEGIPSRFKRVDFVSIAQGLGARGIKIDQPGGFTKKLADDILKTNVPTVVDVLVDEETVPPIGGRIKSILKVVDP